MSDLVAYDRDGDVSLIGLSRPEKRNALSSELVDALAEAARRAGTEAKAIVIHGQGPHFCAGLDLEEHAERDWLAAYANSRRWHAAFDALANGPIPVFAALHGGVIGGGAELAAAAHVRVADRTLKFALPEGQRGIFTGGGGSVRLARLIGVARMTDMMLTGRVLNADEAERAGFMQYLVEAGSAFDKAVELANLAAKNAKLSNFAVLNALPRIQDMAHDDGLFVEAVISAVTTDSEDARHRLKAFLEGRAAPLLATSERRDT